MLLIVFLCQSTKLIYESACILSESDIIFATLSSAGLQVLNDIAFDFIVVDESTQSVEPSTLIPLRFKAKAYVLVGDPQQLPATVISNVDQYKCSLFERFMKNGVKPCLLDGITSVELIGKVFPCVSLSPISNARRDSEVSFFGFLRRQTARWPKYT